MLGGGIWTVPNKILPGSYINFVDASRAATGLGDRGIATIALPFSWAPENTIFEVTSTEFRLHCREIFGCDITDQSLVSVRELFLHANKVIFYNLNTGGVRATSTYADAKYPGARGNEISIVIRELGLDFIVETYLSGIKVDDQLVETSADLKPNKYVDFKPGSQLAETAGTALSGGQDGTATGESHQNYLRLIESYAFNTMGCTSIDPVVKQLYIATNKRLRDNAGIKYQLIIATSSDFNVKVDYEGVIECFNRNAIEIIPWLTGAESACPINKSLTNYTYDGEIVIDTDLAQSVLEVAIQTGKLVFHRVGEEVRILRDINSLTTYSDTKKNMFSLNQTIRVLDQIANGIAILFNDRYLGKTPNDNAGRVSFWSELIQYCKELETIRAIEAFDSKDVKVEPGVSKTDIVVTTAVTPVSSMEKLYMTVYVN